MGVAVPASTVVLDEDKDGVEPVGARYVEEAQTGARSRGVQGWLDEAATRRTTG
jgi:hypothetical protein